MPWQARGSSPKPTTNGRVSCATALSAKRDPASLTESSRLYLNETDDGFYQDYLVQIREPRNPRRLPKSNRLLWQCLQTFKNRLDELPDLRHDGRAVASLLSETVARQLLFILITVDDELNAYTVFETLNARGLELTTTDLLKNHLFSRIRVSADLEALQRRWRSLMDTVEQERFPELLRYHVLCELPKVRSQRLFKLVRQRTTTPDHVFELLGELEGRAEVFVAVADPNHHYWVGTRDARKHVRELNLFRVRQMMPLLFAAWESFSLENFVRVLRIVSVVSFRYTVVSGLNPSALEAAFHYAAKAVSDRVATTPGAVFERLQPIYVEDAKMRQDFSGLEVGTGAARESWRSTSWRGWRRMHPGGRATPTPTLPRSSTSCRRIRTTNGTRISITRAGMPRCTGSATSRCSNRQPIGASATLPISTRSLPMVGAGTHSVRTSRRWHRSSGRRSCWKSVRDAWRRARYTCGESISADHPTHPWVPSRTSICAARTRTGNRRNSGLPEGPHPARVRRDAALSPALRLKRRSG